MVSKLSIDLIMGLDNAIKALKQKYQDRILVEDTTEPSLVNITF